MAFDGATLRSIGDILRSYAFVVPDYQRGYAWRESQWDALWQDLAGASRRPSNGHFTGMMLLARKGSGDGNQVEVVDGQQRAITIMMLANVLRKLIDEQRVQYDITFAEDTDTQNYFNFYVNGQQEVSARLGHTPSSYALNIRDGSRFFEEKAKGLAPEAIASRLGTLLNDFSLFVLDVAIGFDIHTAFETLNNRGRKLSQMELLKNRLIYLTTVLPDLDGSDPRDLRRQIHQAWKGIYRSLGRSAKTQGQDDDFLLAHATAYFGKKRQAGWLEKKLLDTEFSQSNPDLSETAIRKYIANLERAAGWWSHIHDPSRLPKAHQKWLERIHRAGFAYFKPLVLAAYMRVTAESAESVAEPEVAALELEPISILLKEIERFVVTIYRLLGHKADLGRAHFETRAVELMDPQNTILGKEASEFSNEEAILFVARYIRAFASNYPIAWDSEDEPTRWIDDSFQWDGEFDTDELKLNLDKRLRDGPGYYTWDFTALLLWEYEQSFRGQGNAALKLSWEEFSFDETVEHIYPQKPEGKGQDYWDSQIAIDGRSTSLRRIVHNSLGNLLLLSGRDNSRVSNGPYVSKSEDEKDKVSRYRNGSYSAGEVAAHFAHWNVLSIAARGVALLKFAEKRWDISLSEEADNYTTYLPYLFGSASEQNRVGKGIGGKFIRKDVLERAAAPLILRIEKLRDQDR